MSIHRVKRRRGQGYEVRYWDGPRKRSKTFDRRKDAETFEAETRRRRALGTLADLDAGTELLWQFGEDWFRQRLAQKTLAPVTYRRYAEIWDKHVLPHLGGYQLRELKPAVIEDFSGQLQADGVGAPTVRKALFMLQSCLGAAARHGLIADNPVKLVAKPRQTKATVRPIPPELVERMRAAVGQRDATLLSVLAYAGLRPGEAIALTWGQIRDRTILVDRAVSLGEDKDTKTHVARTVRLLKPVAQDLAEWKLASGRPADDQLVFPRRDAGAWSESDYRNWRRRVFKPAAQAAGLDRARPYDLRHSFASLLLHQGMSVVEIAAQLGHQPTVTLDTYGHVIDELADVREDAEEIIRQARAPKRERKAS
jgi:integrase